MRWHAVDGEGLALATGREAAPPGAPTPVAALAAAPVVRWPVGVRADDGRPLSLGQAIGPGGERVESLLARLVGARRPVGTAAPATLTGTASTRLPPSPATVTSLAALAAATPAGPVDLPLALVPLPAGVEAAADVDSAWLEEVDERRSASRRALVAARQEAELEAALHVAVLVATERLDPADDTDVGAHVASGAQLWLLTAAVASALAVASAAAGARPDPFASWAELVVAGLWPIGPSRGRLVVCDPGRPA